MKTICKIYLVRHGESVTNRDAILGGHTDSPLTETGKQQARQTKKALGHIHFDAAYSSDLQRARDTAEIIYGQPLATANQIFNLRERNFGSLEGKPDEHLTRLREAHREHYEALSKEAKWYFALADDMESNHLLSSRFLQALRDIAERHVGETVLVASHGGCIRTMLFKLGWATEEEIPPGTFSNAGYVELDYSNGKFKVQKVVGTKKQKALPINKP